MKFLKGAGQSSSFFYVLFSQIYTQESRVMKTHILMLSLFSFAITSISAMTPDESKTERKEVVSATETATITNPLSITREAITLTKTILNLQTDYFILVARATPCSNQKPLYSATEQELAAAYGNLARLSKPLFDLLYIPFAQFTTIFNGPVEEPVITPFSTKIIIVGPKSPDPNNKSDATVTNIVNLMRSQNSFIEYLLQCCLDQTHDTDTTKKESVRKTIVSKDNDLFQDYVNQSELYPQVFGYLIKPKMAALSALAKNFE